MPVRVVKIDYRPKSDTSTRYELGMGTLGCTLVWWHVDPNNTRGCSFSSDRPDDKPTWES